MALSHALYEAYGLRPLLSVESPLVYASYLQLLIVLQIAEKL
jgi:hypothetical protein